MGLRIVEESVVDRNGKIVNGGPEDFLSLTNACKILSAFLETGLDHQIVNRKEVMAE